MTYNKDKMNGSKGSETEVQLDITKTKSEVENRKYISINEAMVEFETYSVFPILHWIKEGKIRTKDAVKVPSCEYDERIIEVESIRDFFASKDEEVVRFKNQIAMHKEIPDVDS